MKKIWKLLILILFLVPFTFTYKVKAEGILNVEKIKQIQNRYNVNFNVISNTEVSAVYDDLGDTLEFEITIKNFSSNKNVRLKNITILTDSEGVDYSATMNSENLELGPNETRTIRVTGVLNNKAFDSEKIIKFQIHYSISDRPCPDCDKPIPVIVNPKTGDSINYSFVILGASILGIILIILLLFILFKKKNNKNLMILLLALSLNICLYPLYSVKADSDYVLEIILHQTIRINKLDDVITVNEKDEPYTGDPIDGDFDDISKTPITPIYYDDDACQNPINGKPTNAGIYYATATSEGNNWYKPGVLECTKIITIEKAPSTCPNIEDIITVYDGSEHSLDIGTGLSGGELNYSLDNITWTNVPIKISNAGNHTIYTKVVGDNNHSDSNCGIHTISITKSTLTVKASDQTKVYDGTPLVADATCEIVGESDGFEVSCVSTGSIEDVGETDKEIQNVIIIKDGIDVSDNYDVTPITGTLKVTPNPISTLGTCINPTYSNYAQNLIEGGNLVEYTDNVGIDAGDYNIVATAAPNYAFEDGSTLKTIPCKILKRGLEITPVTQDIEYGQDIVTDLSMVEATNLLPGHEITAIVLTKQSTEVTSEGKIKASNAIIKEGDIVKNDNYEIDYKEGTLRIHYLSTFAQGEHCEAPEQITKKSYNNSLKLNGINPSTGYSAEGWYKNDNRVGSPNETITIDGSYTYTSRCIDDIPPTLHDLTVTPDDSDLNIEVTAQDLGSGSTKVEWFYKKCGDASYQQLPTTTFEATRDRIVKSTQTNSCLRYGSYYVYVKVTDEAGNVRTSSPVKVDLNVPTTEKVDVNSSTVGTTCKSLECTLNELLRYFK